MRRRAMLIAAVVSGAFAVVSSRGVRAVEPIAARYKPGSLESFLALRLSVARPQDAAFIERVAELVRGGELPESVVRGTCEWAVLRAQKRGAKYPFPYFQAAMPVKARHFGVVL